VRARCVIFTFCLISLLAGRPVHAQEADVRADVSETLAALVAGDAVAFTDFFHKDARGFFVNGASVVEGISAMAFRAALLTGLQTNVVMTDLNVKAYGNTAVSAALLGGSVTLPGGAVRTGRWRYSDTRVLEDGTWKVVQYHISQLAE
jgi:ketosteroid isomerase-like protein